MIRIFLKFIEGYRRDQLKCFGNRKGNTKFSIQNNSWNNKDFSQNSWEQWID